MECARQALRELAPSGTGVAVDIGCGTGLAADALRDRGYRVIGFDLSRDQLRLARTRIPVAVADARRLPLRDASAEFVCSMLTHTDLDGYERLVAEALRVLVPGGTFVHVGVHPCFNGPFAEPTFDGVTVHAGYRGRGWQVRSPYRGTGGISHRVGAHHLTLEELLAAFLTAGGRVDAVREYGTGPVPDLLAVRVTTPR